MTSNSPRRLDPDFTRLLSQCLKQCLSLVLLTLLTASAAGQVELPDDQYLKIVATIEQGDSLSNSGKGDAAKVKYQQAQAALLNFKQKNPNWNTRVVSYRLNYLAGKLAPPAQPSAPLSPAGSATATASAAPAASAPVAARPAANASAAPSTMQVRLLNPGAEPRKALRFQVKPGDKQSLDMTMQIAMEIGAGSTPGQSMKLPAIQTTMDLLIKSVSPNGDISYEVVFADFNAVDDPGSPSPMAGALKASLGGLKGVSNLGVMSDRGLIKSSEIKAPPGADPQARQSLDQVKDSLSTVSSPLPEEAVGPGAQWEVRQPIKSQGMTINQTVVYELVSIDGDRLQMKSKIAQNAANQKISAPGMESLKVDLVKLATTGQGSSSSSLTQLMPSQANVDSHSEMTIGMGGPEGQQSMGFKVDTSVRLQSK